MFMRVTKSLISHFSSKDPSNERHFLFLFLSTLCADRLVRCNRDRKPCSLNEPYCLQASHNELYCLQARSHSGPIVQFCQCWITRIKSSSLIGYHWAMAERSSSIWSPHHRMPMPIARLIIPTPFPHPCRHLLSSPLRLTTLLASYPYPPLQKYRHASAKLFSQARKSASSTLAYWKYTKVTKIKRLYH